MPSFALLLGLAGIIPFALLGAGAVVLDPATSLRAAHALVAYGAVILSFLGGVHWGFTLSEPAPRLLRTRLSLGVAPALLGWVALALDLFVAPLLGLAVLIAGLGATVLIEARAQRLGLVPAGYMTMRWVITLIVISILTLVALLRVVG